MASFKGWLDFDGAPSPAEAERMVVTELEVSAVQARPDLFIGYPNGRAVRRVYVRRGPPPGPPAPRLGMVGA